jgi:hypothetical protein
MDTARMIIALVFIVTSLINAQSSTAASEKGRRAGGFYAWGFEM